MSTSVRARFWIEAALAGASAGLLALTLVRKDWIEAVFAVDPDAGDGSLEWILSATFLVATIVWLAMARAEWRRYRALPD